MPSRILTLWNQDRLNEEDTRVLRTTCKEVKSPFTEVTQKVISELTETFLAANDAVGLAAPQIGFPFRIIAFRFRNFDEKNPSSIHEDFEILVNPRITQTRGEPVAAEEGCLSCPEIRVEIARHPEIKVRAYDAEGRKVNRRYLDFAARVVQHEMDHLDGKLIVDYEAPVVIPRKRQEFFEKYFQEK